MGKGFRDNIHHESMQIVLSKSAQYFFCFMSGFLKGTSLCSLKSNQILEIDTDARNGRHF